MEAMELLWTQITAACANTCLDTCPANHTFRRASHAKSHFFAGQVTKRTCQITVWITLFGGWESRLVLESDAVYVWHKLFPASRFDKSILEDLQKTDLLHEFWLKSYDLELYLTLNTTRSAPRVYEMECLSVQFWHSVLW